MSFMPMLKNLIFKPMDLYEFLSLLAEKLWKILIIQLLPNGSFRILITIILPYDIFLHVVHRAMKKF
jgi:hypothetical protein